MLFLPEQNDDSNDDINDHDRKMSLYEQWKYKIYIINKKKRTGGEQYTRRPKNDSNDKNDNNTNNRKQNEIK